MEHFKLGDCVWDGNQRYLITDVFDARWASNRKYTMKSTSGDCLVLSGTEISRLFRLYPSNFSFRFIRDGDDTINPQGKVTSYKEVNCIAADEQSARAKSKLSEDYKLSAVFKLNSNW